MDPFAVARRRKSSVSFQEPSAVTERECSQSEFPQSESQDSEFPQSDCRQPIPGGRRMSRRKSLATEAFEQARANAVVSQRYDLESNNLADDNDELQAFVARRQSFMRAYDMKNFAARMTEAISTKKAANRFLRHIRPNAELKSFPTMQAPDKKFHVGESALLDYVARNKQFDSNILTERHPTFSCTKAMIPGSVIQRSRAAKRTRDLIVRQYRSDASPERLEATTALPVSLSPLEKLDKGGLLTEQQQKKQAEEEESSLLATEIELKQYDVPGHDRVTIVAGSVDYGTLLSAQSDMHDRLREKDEEYNKLILMYDRIQYRIQRKFSALLKVDLVKSPELGTSELPELPALPTMQSPDSQ